MKIKTTNTILYCRHWQRTVDFYTAGLGLPVLESRDWFVEFKLSESSRLSLADASRTTIDPNDGKGITITLEIEDINSVHDSLREAGLDPTPIKQHPWGAEIIHLFDPEGNRLEFWCPVRG